MSVEAPPIVKLAERVLISVELAVRHWPQYHKYAHGKTLRKAAFKVAKRAHQAWREKEKLEARTARLSTAVDSLKISLQIAQQIDVFSSFAQFEAIARDVNELGRQAGGWHRQQKHRKGQNASKPESAPQRAQILSPRTASHEATR